MGSHRYVGLKFECLLASYQVAKHDKRGYQRHYKSNTRVKLKQNYWNLKRKKVKKRTVSDPYLSLSLSQYAKPPARFLVLLR